MNEQDKIYSLMEQAEELQTHALQLQKQAQETFKALPLAVSQASKEIQRRGLIQALYVLSLGVIVTAIAPAVIWWTTDSLKVEKAELEKVLPSLKKQVAEFTKKAGKANLSVCGDDRRICVQVDDELSFTDGKGNKYMIIKGY